MRVLVTGVAGQLGYDVINELNKRGLYSIGTDILHEDGLINKANWKRYFWANIYGRE